MDLDTATVTRFVGGNKGGSRRIGPISATVQGTRASIPSRFETVLNSGGHEKQGFGSRTFRFNEAENDRPGPGAYYKPPTMEQKGKGSKKGSAAFASAQRAGFAEDAPMIAPGPGPGSYELAAPVKKSKSADNATHKSPAFCEPQGKRLLKVKLPAKTTPGPGAYLTETSRTVPTGGAMTSKAVREVTVIPTQKTAGPGEYQPDSYVNMTGNVKAPHEPSAFNRSKASRLEKSTGNLSPAKAIAATTALPPTLVEEKQSHGHLPPILAEIALERTGPLVPGRHPDVPKPKEQRSAVFKDTNLDRFGKPTVRYTANNDADVGPGTYEPEYKPKKMLISSSWALSSVPRDEPKDKYRVPGPAYYQPKSDLKKSSYHMLSKDYWSA